MGEGTANNYGSQRAPTTWTPGKVLAVSGVGAAFLFSCCCSGCIVIGMIGGDRDSSRARSQRTTATNGNRAEGSAISLSAEQVVNEYKRNEVAADQKYKGKVLQVHGQIDAIGKDLTNTMYVVLNGGGEFELRAVQCFFHDRHEAQLGSLSKGQIVKIQGKCDGLMMNVLLKNCTLVQ